MLKAGTTARVSSPWNRRAFDNEAVLSRTHDEAVSGIRKFEPIATLAFGRV